MVATRWPITALWALVRRGGTFCYWRLRCGRRRWDLANRDRFLRRPMLRSHRGGTL